MKLERSRVSDTVTYLNRKAHLQFCCFARKSKHILQGYMEHIKWQLIRHIVYISISCYNQTHKLLQFVMNWLISQYGNSELLDVTHITDIKWKRILTLTNTCTHTCTNMHLHTFLLRKLRAYFPFDQIWAIVTVWLKTWALFLISICS